MDFDVPLRPDSSVRIQQRRNACYEREITALKARVVELQKINNNSCLEWAEDHTHLQDLCHEAGCTEYEVEGDIYGVPGIGDLADLLAKKLADERETSGKWRDHYNCERDRAERLQKALEDERANSARLAAMLKKAPPEIVWHEAEKYYTGPQTLAITQWLVPLCEETNAALAAHEALRKP